jgi:hypothetical protein
MKFYDKYTLQAVIYMLRNLHYQHKYKGAEKKLVDDTIEYVVENVEVMLKNWS